MNIFHHTQSVDTVHVQKVLRALLLCMNLFKMKWPNLEMYMSHYNLRPTMSYTGVTTFSNVPHSLALILYLLRSCELSPNPPTRFHDIDKLAESASHPESVKI